MAWFICPEDRIRLRRVEDHYRVEIRDPSTRQWKVWAVVNERRYGVQIVRRLVEGIGRKAA